MKLKILGTFNKTTQEGSLYIPLTNLPVGRWDTKFYAKNIDGYWQRMDTEVYSVYDTSGKEIIKLTNTQDLPVFEVTVAYTIYDGQPGMQIEA